MSRDRWTIGLAVFFAAFAALTLGVWIPNDIETGVIAIGDAMAPTFVAAAMLVVGLIMGVLECVRPGAAEGRPRGLDGSAFKFVLRLGGLLVVSLLLMIYVGPLTVDVINGLGHDIGTYRQLRDTVPYKYLGYVTGGFVLVFGVTSLVENRFSRASGVVALAAVAVLVVLYDVPFDDLLLPPNSDQ